MKGWGDMTDFFMSQIVHLQAASSVFLLTGFLVAAIFLQQRALAQSGAVLLTASDRVRGTELFQSAHAYFERRRIRNPFLNRTYAIPVWFLILVVLFGSFFAYFGAEYFADAETPSYVLGGAYAVGGSSADSAVRRYQSGTVFIESAAFMGAYVWILAALMARIRNNDINPINYYLLSMRILVACLVASIVRHIADAVPVLHTIVNYKSDPAGYPVGLAVLGFVIGWNPTLWLPELYLWASATFKSPVPAQRAVLARNLPQDMPLLMVQGMVDDKIRRMHALDIDSCHKLAKENAIVLWARTAFNLELIADWVAQAQLCVLLEDDKIEALRRAGIRDVFGYVAAISSEPGRKALQGVLSMPPDLLARQSAAIIQDPAYQRLLQLRKALQTG
jgi:hypothetical protein